MKESEMHNLKPAWQYAKAGYEYTHILMNPDDVPVEEGQSFPTNTGRNLIDLDEKLLLKKKQVLLPFSNTMVHCKTRQTQMQGYKLHVMIHAPYPEDKSSLPNGVYVLKTYTELKDGSRNVSVVLQNLTSKTIHLAPGQCVARVAAANEVPEAVPLLELVKDLEEALPKEAPKLSIEERQKLLMELLRQDGGLEQLKEWPPELALKFERMLMEHHHIFSLDKNEIGCTDSAEHIIELMDDAPFKKRFWWPGMVNALSLVIQNCGHCKQFEAKCQIPEMEPILCTQPMELVHVDYVGMEVTVAAQEKPVVKNVLVIVYYFTRYVQAFVTNNHTAHTTARVLYNSFFSVFGFPQKLMSDQGN